MHLNRGITDILEENGIVNTNFEHEFHEFLNREFRLLPDKFEIKPCFLYEP